uniref:ATP synthase subunit a n=1 Tax=Pardachirus pavoninus TaxID=8286 RepID=X2LCL7_PARPV|nr:ATP synthase F0 subunit 6 [Pardachirus pavoninus]AHN95322.1 ATP synthase F0 subunit 6 [Pardachirus pavoninus]AID59828.1 ATP synthase F0 subunit 6 [Pardachirus pavoninus]BAX09220.1 ATPase subunit 6 [Pardachirus pavoninus]
MTLTYFDQFTISSHLGIPLFLLAVTLPWALYPKTLSTLVANRTLALQGQLIFKFLKQLLSPLPESAHKWAVMFASLLIYLITLNMLGLLPYTFTPTTQLSLNLGLALPLWLATVIIGMRDYPARSLAHFLPPGTPLYLIPLLIIIETISLLIRPLSLAIRLTANLTAGHLMIQLIATAALSLAPLMPALALSSFTLLALLTLLEIAVAMIQAYVFVLLLSLYLQENT